MKIFCVLIIASGMLTGCHRAQEALGLTRHTLEEYDTLDLPPLTLPPKYDTLPCPEAREKSHARERAKAALSRHKQIPQSPVKKAAPLLAAPPAAVPNVADVLEEVERPTHAPPLCDPIAALEENEAMCRR